jgi:sirohydrochlorin ferrochelatase
MSVLTAAPAARHADRDRSAVALKDVVLAAHGSRDPRAAADTRRLVAAVASARPDLRVRDAYLDFTAPALGAALHGEFGPTTVVPLLFTPAYHARVDVPSVVDAAVDRGVAVAATPVLGPTGPDDPGLDLLVSALIRRLGEATYPPGSWNPSGAIRQLDSKIHEWGVDAVVLGAAGSRDESALDTVETVAHAIGYRLRMPCVIGYATGAGRTVSEAVNAARDAGARRLGYASMFLASGLLADRAALAARTAGVGAIAAPLADAPEIARLIGIRVDSTIV